MFEANPNVIFEKPAQKMDRASLAARLLPVLYEDDVLLVVEKPAGVDAGDRPDQSVPGIAELMAGLKGERRLIVVNRLSRYESGVLLLSRTPGAADFIRGGLREGLVECEYVTVSRADAKVREVVLSGGKHAVSNKALRGRVDTRSREKRANRAPRLDRGAVQIKVLQRGEKRSLLRCRTTVENTHALRAMLRGGRFRVIGDFLGERFDRKASQHKTCLHLTKISFLHPQLRTKTSVTSPTPKVFSAVVEGRWSTERALHAALVRRLPCILENEIDSFRLLCGNVEDIPGLVVEKFGSALVLQIHDARPALMEALPTVARWYAKWMDVRSVHLKDFAKGGAESSFQGSGRSRLPGLKFGEPEDDPSMVAERGLRFRVWLNEGNAIGLFLDQRDNRSRVRALSGGKDVLNLFAYTCSFSVAAAAGGARTTVSVDLSMKHLARGRDNFALNELSMENHFFVQMNAFDFCRRAAKEGRQFDFVIIDPPTYAHGRSGGQDFSISRDLGELLSAVIPLIRANGQLLVSTNHRRMALRSLLDQIKRGAGGRRYEVIETPKLPPDFAMDTDYSKSTIVRIT